MTEKRFTETLSTGIVADNITGKEYKCEMRIDEDLLELINELHEENRELQRHLDVMRSGALTDDKRIKELYDENEQLKQKVDFYKYFQKDARELEKENEQLKQQLTSILKLTKKIEDYTYDIKLIGDDVDG